MGTRFYGFCPSLRWFWSRDDQLELCKIFDSLKIMMGMRVCDITVSPVYSMWLPEAHIKNFRLLSRNRSLAHVTALSRNEDKSNTYQCLPSCLPSCNELIVGTCCKALQSWAYPTRNTKFVSVLWWMPHYCSYKWGVWGYSVNKENCPCDTEQPFLQQTCPLL